MSTRPISDYSKYLNKTASRREPSAVRALQKLISRPGMINLGGGMPAADMFPFEEISVDLKSGEKLSIKGDDLYQAMQYTSSYGLESLVSYLKRLVEREHHPPYASQDDWAIMVTAGGQHGVTDSFNTFLTAGDTILTECHTYSGILSALRPMGVNIVGLPMDGDGIIPSKMAEILNQFKTKEREGKAPSVLYVIPTGQNPTSATIPNERKKAIYDLACQHDILILEDDPYWNLRLHPYDSTSEDPKNLKSFLSMDTEHRVIRFDSFSKILSPGLRLGWTSAPKQLIENFVLHSQSAILHPSGFSQAIVLSILNHWGDSGFDNHIAQVKDFYSKKRDMFLLATEKHLTGLCEWNKPQAGMFAWLKVIGVEDTTDLIYKKAIDASVAMLPGKVFSPTSEPSPFVRVSFSKSTEEEINEGLKRLRSCLETKK